MASEAEVDLLINAAGALPELERDLGRIIATAQRNADDIDVRAAVDTRDSLDAITADLRAVLRAAEAGAPDIDVVAVLDQLNSLQALRSNLDDLIDEVDAGAPDIDIDAVLNATRSLRTVRRDVDQLVRTAQRSVPDLDIDVDIDVDDANRGVLGLNRTLQGLGRAARTGAGGMTVLAGSMAGAGLAINSAAGLVAGLVTAVESIAPAAAVGTSALLTMQLASGTLKLALVGAEDALTTALDPSKAEEFEDALKKLSPEAQDFARAVRGMGDELRKVQQRVQNNFFRGFDTALKDLAKSAAPDVTAALDDTSKSLNRMALGAAAAATELAEDGILGRALDSATDSLRELEDIPGQATTAFGQLAAAAGPSMERIARAVSDKADEIAKDLTRAFESGQMEAEIEAAIDSIEQLGTIGGNILGGLGNIFRGLTTDGGGLFDILERISEAFERLTASEEFQTILSELSKTADTLVENVLPLLEEAFIQLAPVIKELGPPIRDFINEIGPELIPILKELGPILVDLAVIFREQLPFAIDFLKAALEVLGIALKALDFILDEIVTPAVQTVSDALNNQYVDAIANASRETGNRAIDMAGRFETWRQNVINALDTVGQGLGRFVTSIGSWARQIFNSVQNVINTFTDLPGQITGALGNMASLLFSAGQDVIRGFINGMESLLGRVRNIASEIASTAAGAVTDFLGISSPSRLMREYGQNTIEGFTLGLQDQFPELSREMQDIAASVPQLLADNTAASPRVQVTPQVGVQVRIGNEVVDRYVSVRVQQENRRRDRTLTQGVRV